jgi:Sulfotransferase domain
MLWSAPRSRSTAFFRMMAERGDFTMVHEPFSYLAEFGRTDVAGEHITSAAGLISVLTSLGQDGRVFAKETTGRHYPEVLADRQFLTAGARHTFLIRHPRETIVSYRALDPGAGLHKVGFESQYEIFAEILQLTRRVPVVVDSEDLIARPAAIIRAYCRQAGIDFRPGALTWQPSDRPEWQPSRRWHADAAASTGFARMAGRPVPDLEQDPVLSGYLSYHLPFYEKLHTRRLTALSR